MVYFYKNGLGGAQTSMKFYHSYRSQPGTTRRRFGQIMCTHMSLSLLLLSSTGCAGLNEDRSEHVNGFGTVKNHSHSLLVFPNKALVYATHHGLFRSTDAGQSWQKVAARSGQLMEGVMTTSMVVSPIDAKRLYVLADPVTSPDPAMSDTQVTFGLYTSTDQGLTWELAIPTEKSGHMFLIEAGNEHPDQVYAYLDKLGADGLQVSNDGGKTFTPLGKLPFSSRIKMIVIPDAPEHLLICGNGGIARSEDGGMSWTVLSGLSDWISDFSTVGANTSIYATGDKGVYRSQNAGKTFSLVHDKASLGSLTISPTHPQIVYGKTGTAIFRSEDSGQTWSQLPTKEGTMENLVVDPLNPARIYVSYSYPTAVHMFDQETSQWTSLTPDA